MSVPVYFLCWKKILKETFNFLNVVTIQRNFIAVPLFHLHHVNLCLSKNYVNNLPTIILNRKYMDLTKVIDIFEEHVPPYLAESWDNTGLLIEPSNNISVSTVLFTNDLTEAVLKEALMKKSNLIISYHPPIFSSLKSLKLSNWKDRIIVKCIENSVAVYSPHTSCDAVAGGVNDWLINCFNLSQCHPIHQSFEPQPKYSHAVDFAVHSEININQILKTIPDFEVSCLSINASNQQFRIKVNKIFLNEVIKSLNASGVVSSMSMTLLSPLPLSSCGMGRIGKLTHPLMLSECIKLIKQYLNLDYIRFSQAVSHSLDTIISTVAVCAGSGSSVLKGVNADLYITGEMSHHDLLDVNHRNVSVILCEHSNSERGYLQQLVESLSSKLNGVNLIISVSDKDPVCII